MGEDLERKLWSLTSIKNSLTNKVKGWKTIVKKYVKKEIGELLESPTFRTILDSTIVQNMKKTVATEAFAKFRTKVNETIGPIISKLQVKVNTGNETENKENLRFLVQKIKDLMRFMDQDEDKSNTVTDKPKKKRGLKTQILDWLKN